MRTGRRTEMVSGDKSAGSSMSAALMSGEGTFDGAGESRIWSTSSRSSIKRF